MRIAVIDIGKTNAKLALVGLDNLTELAVITRSNTVLPGPPYPHFDVEGHWTFLLQGLADFHRLYGIDGISITTHGASAALLGPDGALVTPVLDYEHCYPDGEVAAYTALRPDFAETGSPRLAGGLNLGAQLHYLFASNPNLRARTAHIVTYPQYWAHRLTGVLASDVTSLGCHTDLWNPYRGRFSSLIDRLGIGSCLALPGKPADVLGHILPAIAAVTGLPASTPVTCGIHDSNASLLPHLLAQTPPFSVVSTGTWVVVMTVGGKATVLDATRDTLINVNAFGRPVPSARFMGGREYETMRGHAAAPSMDDVRWVLQHPLFLLPSVQQSSGPFPNMAYRWNPFEPGLADPRNDVALAFYLALMTAECLLITGASGAAIVEGPFASNALYLAMLRAATDFPVTASVSKTGTAIGAAMLFADPMASDGAQAATNALSPDAAMIRYAKAWRAAVALRINSAATP